MIQLTAAEDVNTISSMGSRRCAELLRVDSSDCSDSPREKMICLAVKDSSTVMSSRHFASFLFRPTAMLFDPDNHHLNAAGYFRLMQAGACAVLCSSSSCFHKQCDKFSETNLNDPVEAMQVQLLAGGLCRTRFVHLEIKSTQLPPRSAKI